MIAAISLPRVLKRASDRRVILIATAIMVAGLALGAWISAYPALLVLWFVIGLGYAGAQTPSGRLLRRSSHTQDRSAVFAAQFTLSHAMWLIAYPLAGWLGAEAGTSMAFIALMGLCATGLVVAVWLWPKAEGGVIVHRHDDLSPDDPHWREGAAAGHRAHAHPYIIDRHHPVWPREP